MRVPAFRPDDIDPRYGLLLVYRRPLTEVRGLDFKPFVRHWSAPRRVLCS